MPENVIDVIKLMAWHRVSFTNINLVLDAIGVVIKDLCLGSIYRIEFDANVIRVKTRREGGESQMSFHQGGICKIVVNRHDLTDTGSQFSIDPGIKDQLQLYFSSPIVSKD